MPYADHAKNAMLDADGITHLSLHTAYSATGTNEVTGGSPAYARKAVTFGSAASGAKTSTDAQAFDVPASTTVGFVGSFDALTSGNFKGMWPLGSTASAPFRGAATGDLITEEGHARSDTDRVVLFGTSLPTGLTAGVIYYVISSATDQYQVSLTSGGAAVTITADGTGQAYDAVPETFGSQGTLTLAIGDTDLDLNLIT